MNDWPVIKNGGEELPWVELKLDAHLANTTEDIDRNIEYALGKGYTGLHALVGTESGAVSVVGSGPSLKENWQRLRDSDTDIIACNAACQFLLEKGIVPKYMFCFDADPLMLEFITPHPEITYLMGSRCPPKAFELLEGCKVVLWHAAGDENIEKLLQKHKIMEPMLAGGSAAVTRAMMLSHAMGYREIHLWGVDSSFSNGNTHIRKSTTDEKNITILLNKKVFTTAPWMCVQATDFKVLAPQLARLGARLIVHGDGLIPHLAKSMGFEVDGESKVRRTLYNVITKTRILWSQL